jgi:hypothetical protein
LKDNLENFERRVLPLTSPVGFAPRPVWEGLASPLVSFARPTRTPEEEGGGWSPGAPAMGEPHGSVAAWLRKLVPSRTCVRTDLRTLRLAIAYATAAAKPCTHRKSPWSTIHLHTNVRRASLERTMYKAVLAWVRARLGAAWGGDKVRARPGLTIARHSVGGRV